MWSKTNLISSGLIDNREFDLWLSIWFWYCWGSLKCNDKFCCRDNFSGSSDCSPRSLFHLHDSQAKYKFCQNFPFHSVVCISYWQGRSWIFLRCGWSDIWNISSATLAISKPHHHSALISPFPSRFSHDDDSVFVFSWNKGLTPPVIELFDGYTEAWCCIISDGWLISRLLRVIAALGCWPSNAILCIRACSHWLQHSFLSSVSCCQHVIYVLSLNLMAQ